MAERAGSKIVDPHPQASQAHGEPAQVALEPTPVLLRTTSILKKRGVSSASAKCAGDTESCSRVLGAPVVANVSGPATTAWQGATARGAEHTNPLPSEGTAPHRRCLPSRLEAATHHTAPAPSPTRDMDQGNRQTVGSVSRRELPVPLASEPEARSFPAVHAGEGYLNPQMGSNRTRAGRSAYETMLPGSFYALPNTAGSTYSGPDREASMYGAVLSGSFYASPATAGGACSFVSVPSLYVQRTNSSADSCNRSSAYGGMVRGVDCAFGTQSSLYDLSRDSPAWGHTLGSLYGGGSIALAVQKDAATLCPNIATIGKHNALRRSGKRGGVKVNAKMSACADVPSGCVHAARPAQGSARDASATANSTEHVQVPDNYNIHSLVVIDSEGGCQNDVKVTASDGNSVAVMRDDGGCDTFANDECIVRGSAPCAPDSVLLSDLRSNWVAGRSSGLLVGAGSGRSGACASLVRDFLQDCLRHLEEEKRTRPMDFDVTMTLGEVESSDRILDLLAVEKGARKPVQLASNPVYGPCLVGMSNKILHTAEELCGVFDEAMERAGTAGRPVVGYFVLKQVRKSNTTHDVYLSCLCVGLFGEDVSRLAAIRDKSPSEPHMLFRYAIGGGSVTVFALVLSACDSQARQGLEELRGMRKVKNTPPRSGNVRRCLDVTKKEIKRLEGKMEGMSTRERLSADKLMTRMQLIASDAEELLSQPETTTPRGYAIC